MSRIADLQEKEVINIKDCIRLGYISDIEIDIRKGNVINIIVQGDGKIFNFFGKESEYIIPWDNIKKIGDDIILVDIEGKKHFNTD